MSYIETLLIIKLMFINIEFKVFRKAGCIYNNLAKSKKEIKLD